MSLAVFRADGRHGLPPDNDGDEDGYYDDNEVERAESPEVQNNDHVTSTEDHVTAQSDLVTSSNKDDYVMFHPLQEEDWESEFNRLCQVGQTCLAVSGRSNLHTTLIMHVFCCFFFGEFDMVVFNQR